MFFIGISFPYCLLLSAFFARFGIFSKRLFLKYVCYFDRIRHELCHSPSSVSPFTFENRFLVLKTFFNKKEEFVKARFLSLSEIAYLHNRYILI